MLSHVKNMELNERAGKVTTGCHSNLRMPAGYTPVFVEGGKGAHVWDVDGNEYIDYTCGSGPGILGYSNEDFIHALKEQLGTLYYSTAGLMQTPSGLELCERIVDHVPCAEKVRLCLSGTDAVQLAIRLARAYTGKPLFIRFEGHYHGWMDNVLGGVVDDDTRGRPFAVESNQDSIGTQGKAPGAYQQSFKLSWNDTEALEKVLEEYADEVAMILMEPILCNGFCCMPRPGYLERVRELCTHYGIVLCFDEVITGFRVGLSCAQGLLGVTPDLTTFGKAIGGGAPISVVAGRQDIMDLLVDRRVVGGGAFNASPYGVAAALATLRILEKDDGAFYRRLDDVQGRLVSGLRQSSRRRGVPMLVQGVRGLFTVHFTDIEVAHSTRNLRSADTGKQDRFRDLLADQGILILWGGKFYLSGALTDEDVDWTLDCIDGALNKL